MLMVSLMVMVMLVLLGIAVESGRGGNDGQERVRRGMIEVKELFWVLAAIGGAVVRVSAGKGWAAAARRVL